MSLEHFAVPENKEVFKSIRQRNKSHIDESMSKGHRSQLRVPDDQSGNNWHNKMNRVPLDYNSK